MSWSSNNEILLNSIKTRTTGMAAKTLELSRSSDNVIYLNRFVNNGSGTIIHSDNGSVNRWYSEGLVNYDFMGQSFQGYLGNFFDGHDLTDSNSDGITDTVQVLMGDEPAAQYPLAREPEHYLILD